PGAAEALSASLVVLAFVRPTSMGPGTLGTLQSQPIFAIGLLQLAVWTRTLGSGRALAGCMCLAGSVMIALNGPGTISPLLQKVIAFHLILFVVMFVGAVCSDFFGSFLRNLSALLMTVGGLYAVCEPTRLSLCLPERFITIYPL